MIECLRIELNDIRLAALMICMTGFAFSDRDIRTLSMKAFPIVDIGSNLFMAVETQPTLTGFREWLMATFARLFVFRVRLSQFTWHYEPVKKALAVCRKERKNRGQCRQD